MTAFYMSRAALPAATLLAMIAAWLSQATLAFAAPGGPRIAVLPLSPGALVLVAIAGAAVIAAHRAKLSLIPLWLLLLILLPWLPVPLPAALLVWSGPLGWLVLFGVAVLTLAPLVKRARPAIQGAAIGRVLDERPRLCAGMLAFLIFSAAAWQVAPSVPGGDEPHYLVITQSLLLDGDLKIENNHRRGDYQAYFGSVLPPHYIQRGRDGEIYSIHAPGLPAIVAPAFALGGYRAVVLLLIFLSACGSALAWHVAWLATRTTGSAWFGWAATTLSATAIFHSFTIYPDGLGGILVLTGVWAILRAGQERVSHARSLLPWLLHGAAIALLPWLHSRFAVLAGSLGALILLRLPHTKNPAAKAVAFLSVPAVSAFLWMLFFVVVYGRPDPSAPYGTASGREFSLAFVPGGLTGLLFDQRFGLLANAPVLVFALVGLGLMFRMNAARRGEGLATPRLAGELLFVVVPYFVTATSYAMWWAGWSAPARFANPAVYTLAIPCAVAWTWAAREGHRASRVIAAGALALTIFISGTLVGIDGGRLAYNTRESSALWLEWASGLAVLSQGVPAWYRGQEGAFARDVAVWAGVLLIAAGGVRALAVRDRFRDGTRYATAAAALFALSAMVALSLVWRLHRVDGMTAVASQLEILRRVATEPRALALQLNPLRRLDRANLVLSVRIGLPVTAGGGTGRNERPLVILPALPAGRYRVLTEPPAPNGWLIVGVGQDQFSIYSGPNRAFELDLPVDVRSLAVRGDGDIRRAIDRVVLDPIAIAGPPQRLTDRLAGRAVKYDAASVFFLDDTVYPEPDAFWIAGASEGSFVVQPARPGTSLDVHVRNAPVENRVVLTSGQWSEEIVLSPGEERRMRIPIAPGRRAALVTVSTSAGFRPSAAVADSRDGRFLGLWIRFGQ